MTWVIRMKTETRRAYLKRLTLAAAGGALATAFRPVFIFAKEAEPQPAPTESEAAAIAEIARETMEAGGAPGLSVAIARHGQFVYRQGFGYADKSAGERVTTSSLFRIASISKPITSVAIFTLIEQERLGLNDLVFGAEGRLKFDYGEHYPERVTKITVHHLLTHTCGGWENDASDPMFYKPEMSQRDLIIRTLREQPLKNEPGTKSAYSNFGFCLLGRVIEKITGQTYAQFVRQSVLAKCGVADMRIGGNTLAERAGGEVVYYGQKGWGTNPYDMNIARMDSHGGWIGTPSDLVQFAMHVDGFQTTPNILVANTIRTMTTGSAADPGYACGWAVNKIPNWWHGGSLPGTLTIMVRTASGLCWAAFANTRGDKLNLDQMMWKMARSVPAWRS